MQRQVQPTSSALRAANRARVVRALRHAGWATRADLVGRTGLSRATVSSVVAELGRRGLIAERVQPPAGTRGRPAAHVALDRSAGTAIAVDIGVRHLAVAVGDLSHSVLAERWTTMPRDHTAAHGARIVLDSIEQTLVRAGVDTDDLVGAAVSIAAPVATAGDRLAVPDVLPGWNGSTLADSVSARWSIPVVTENDANLGALGEALRDGAPDDADVLFVKIASRVGLGVTRGGRIVRGRHGYAGEFGHVTVRPRGERCWCGRRGCLELYAGGDGMLRRLAGDRSVPDNAVTTLAGLVAAADHDRRVATVVDDGVAALAAALADVVLVLDPGRVVLGGELTALGARVLDPLRAAVASLPFGTPTPVEVSPLGERASLVGALRLVLTEPVRFADHAGGPSAPRAGPTPALPPHPVPAPSPHGVHL